MEQKSLTTPNKSLNLQDSLRENAKWEACYSFDGSANFYLTDSEKEYFVSTLSKGAKFVEIRGNVLSGQFLYMRLSGDWLRKSRTSNLDHYTEISEEQREKNLKHLAELKSKFGSSNRG